MATPKILLLLGAATLNLCEAANATLELINPQNVAYNPPTPTPTPAKCYNATEEPKVEIPCPDVPGWAVGTIVAVAAACAVGAGVVGYFGRRAYNAWNQNVELQPLADNAPVVTTNGPGGYGATAV